ncbi:MAG: carbohydrate ABC transporter permease [Saccharofermentanales bacterium]
MTKPKNRHRTFSLENKDSLAGLLFILPWLIGAIFFFVKPLIMVVYYAFHEVSFPDGGGIAYKYVGFNSFIRAFTEDTTFVRSFFESIMGILTTSIFIIFFSMFVALILKSKFRGRVMVRAIFFLPVIIAAGPILEIINGDTIAKLLMSGQQSSTMFGVVSMQSLLLDMGLPLTVATAFTTVINGIFNLSWKSGMQILLFLAGLQNVPTYLYEAAEVEGASRWESFWRVTFPMITPVLMLNSIYTIIEGFTDYSNTIVKLIVSQTQKLYLSYAAALGTTYFLIVFLMVGLIYLVINRRTFYMEK